MTVFNALLKKKRKTFFPTVRVVFNDDTEKTYDDVQYIHFSSLECIKITTNNQENVINSYQLENVRLISYIY